MDPKKQGHEFRREKTKPKNTVTQPSISYFSLGCPRRPPEQVEHGDPEHYPGVLPLHRPQGPRRQVRGRRRERGRGQAGMEAAKVSERKNQRVMIKIKFVHYELALCRVHK